MRLLTILALIFVGLYFPVAFMHAVTLQADLDARDASMARLARVGR